MNKILYFDTNEADNATYIEPDSTVASQSNVKDGYIYMDAKSHEWQVGIMPTNEAENIEIDPKCNDYSDNNYYIIPEGYHTGKGKVHVKDLSEYTVGTATSEDIAENKVAWVDGNRIVGILDASQAKSEGTATSFDIAAGKIAWVNGEKLVGELDVYSRQDKVLLAGQSYTIPRGIHPGTSIVSAATLASQTQGTATIDTILKGETAWVNGYLVEGIFDADDAIAQILANTDAKREQVAAGKKFYSAVYGAITEGTMADHSGESPRTINPGESFNIPEGYYNGLSIVKGVNLEDVTIGSANSDNILVDKTAWVNGEKVTGTMPFNDIIFTELLANQSYIIPKGYHTGNGVVHAKDLASQTVGDAIAENILLDKTAWVNGEKIIGTMPINKPVEAQLNAGEHYHIEEGYHDGSGWIWANDIESQTEGNLTPDTILDGYHGWSNGEEIYGSIPIKEQVILTLKAGDTYFIPRGFHDGSSTITALGMEYQTEGTAKEDDIISGQTAWVNGKKLTGTLAFNGTASPDDMLEGYTFYNNDPKNIRTGTLKLTGDAKPENVQKGISFYSDNPKNIQVGTLELTGDALRAQVIEGKVFYTTDPSTPLTGTMVQNPDQNIEILIGDSYTIPEGYHSGHGTVFCAGSGGTADETDIIKDKTAWVNGRLITGELELTGTAMSNCVLAGYSFYNTNPKNIIQGSIPTLEQEDVELEAGTSITIDPGYYPNGFTISAASLESQTQGTADAEDIVIDKTAWVNGIQITGTIPDGDTVKY